MGAGSHPDGAESYRRECKKRISTFFESGLKFVLFVLNVPFQYVIVYHEAKGIRLAASVPPFICIDAGETRRYSRMEQSGSSPGP